jgi:hypothetical protein
MLKKKKINSWQDGMIGGNKGKEVEIPQISMM